jgi:hypothetical protein
MKLNTLSTSELGGGEWSVSCSGRFTPAVRIGEEAGRAVELVWAWWRKKDPALISNRSLAFQTLDSHSTDFAIPCQRN